MLLNVIKRKLVLILLFAVLKMIWFEETRHYFKKNVAFLACFLRYLEKLNCKLNHLKIFPHISLHIRAVGHWTNKLYEYFEEKEAMVYFGKAIKSS